MRLFNNRVNLAYIGHPALQTVDSEVDSLEKIVSSSSGISSHIFWLICQISPYAEGKPAIVSAIAFQPGVDTGFILKGISPISY